MPTTINIQPGSFERLEFSSTVHPKDEDGDRFAVFRVRLVQTQAVYPHHETNVFVKKAADLDPLIAEAVNLREQLASAEAVEENNKRAARTCCNCGWGGTEDNPLIPVESSAAHPEGLLHAQGCTVGPTVELKASPVPNSESHARQREHAARVYGDDPADHSDSGDVG